MYIKIESIWDFILKGSQEYFETEFECVIRDTLSINFGLIAKYIFVDTEEKMKIVVLIDDSMISKKYWYYSDYSANLKNALIELNLIKNDAKVLIGSFYSEYFYTVINQIGENKNEKAFEKINIIKQLFASKGKKVDWLHVFVENDSRIKIVYKSRWILNKAKRNGNFALLCTLITDTILKIDCEGLLIADLLTYESCILSKCNLFAEFHG